MQQVTRHPLVFLGLAILVTGLIDACSIAATPTPVPTSTRDDFGIISQEPCGPPCFKGIRIGVTTIGEARAILFTNLQNCVQDSAGFENGPLIATWLSCVGQSGDVAVEIRAKADGFYEEGLKVSSIVLNPLGSVTVGQLIDKYGPPDRLYSSISADRTRAEMMLFYDTLQMQVVLRVVRPCCEYPLTINTRVDTVKYFAASLWSYPENTERWRGYRTYKATQKPWNGR